MRNKTFKHPSVPKKVRRELDARAALREYVGTIAIDKEELKDAFENKRKFKRFVKKLTKQAKEIVDRKESE